MSTAQHFDAFISYRRKGGSELARLVRSELERQGYRIFLDVEDLSIGHFENVILHSIKCSPGFIVLLSADSFDSGYDETDWFYREISCAIEEEKTIIPIMMPGFEFHDLENFPRELRGISRHNGIEYSHVYFNAMIKKIIRFLGPPTFGNTAVSGWAEEGSRLSRRYQYVSRRTAALAAAVAATVLTSVAVYRIAMQLAGPDLGASGSALEGAVQDTMRRSGRSGRGFTIKVEFEWSNPTGGAPVIAYDIEYVDLADSTFVHFLDGRRLGIHDSRYVMDFEPGHDYRVRVRGVDAGGRTGMWSFWSTFKDSEWQ